jgi:hypothetical protein
MDQLQPLLVLSALMQQIIALWMEPEEGGAYSADKFASVLSAEELKLVPLLRQLGVNLAGHGASLAPFRCVLVTLTVVATVAVVVCIVII